VFGTLLGGLLIGAILVAVTMAFRDDGSDRAGLRTHSAAGLPELPAAAPTDLAAAAAAAGCTLVHAPAEGDEHDDRAFTAKDYRTNPPTSGDHAFRAAADGIYDDPAALAPLGELVHSLEHGRINLQYRPGTPASTKRTLEAVYAETGGHHLLLYENPTGMPYAVAATAWRRLLGCPRMDAATVDALRAFTAAYVDRGPERVP
jgi:hypothetical protein